MMTPELFVLRSLADLKPMTKKRQQDFLDRIDALREMERERCAQLCEHNHNDILTGDVLARKIRSLK